MGRGRSAGIAFLLLVALGLLLPASAVATSFDFLAPGTQYVATTYAGHANYFATRAPARYTVDVEMPEGTPIYAPESGTVQQVSSGWGGGYGNSIVWTSADGRERIHVAHMRDVEPRFAAAVGAKEGPAVAVWAGDLLGHVGHTGDCDPPDFSHMHLSRSFDGAVAPLVLSGVSIDPWRASLVVSAGPARPVMRPDSALALLEDPIALAGSGVRSAAPALHGGRAEARSSVGAAGLGGASAADWLPVTRLPAVVGLPWTGGPDAVGTACAPWWPSYWRLAPAGDERLPATGRRRATP